jgi:hypothetical protein
VITLQIADPSSRQRGRPQIQDRKFQTVTYQQEVISGSKSHKGTWCQDILTDWLTVSRKVTSTSNQWQAFLRERERGGLREIQGDTIWNSEELTSWENVWHVVISSDVWCEMIEQEWCICYESVKSSDQYLSTLKDVTERRTEELNCEKWSLLLDEQRASYNSRFFTKYNDPPNLPTITESQLWIYV